MATQGTTNAFGYYTYTVKTPTGAELHLQTLEEAQRYEYLADRYQKDNSFSNVSDLQDLDRLLILEVISYRWQLWLAQGFDYQNARVDEHALKGNIKEYSVETRLLKQSLGIDKSTRDKDKGESLADYTGNLLNRAKEFGYHRNQQYEYAVTKFWELRSLVMTYDRCDEEERSQLDLSPDSILEFLRVNVIAPWDEMEAAYRKQQTMWIRAQ